MLSLPSLVPRLFACLPVLGFSRRTLRSLSASQKGLVVAVEGNIGVGKSTLCSALGRGDTALGRVRTCRERTPEGLLRLFYPLANRSRYALTLQAYMLSLRMDDVRLGQYIAEKEGTTTILDRSPVGDLVFAVWNWLEGNINEEERKAYLEMAALRRVGDAARSIDILVHLYAPPDTCKTRAGVRSNVEQGVETDYFMGIDAVYFYALLRCMTDGAVGGTTRFLTLDWSKFIDPYCVADLVDTVWRRPVLAPRVQIVRREDLPNGSMLATCSHAHWAEPGVGVYPPRDTFPSTPLPSVLSDRPILVDESSRTTVYIPWHVCTLPFRLPFGRGQCWIHSPPYRHLVLRHLTLAHDIVFYYEGDHEDDAVPGENGITFYSVIRDFVFP